MVGVLFILTREKRRNKSRSSAGHLGWLGEEETKIIVQKFIGELEKG